MNTTQSKRGRPKTSSLTRAAQVREAKRGQRERERAAGITTVSLRVPARQAGLLKAAQAMPGFENALNGFLEGRVVNIDEWPALRELAWNRATRYLSAPEALALYERNWRHVDEARLQPDEAVFIEHLKNRFGAGVMHV